jgi:hypothetical protein
VRNFLTDLRFGLRVLRKSPGFALIVIAVLALGIGANAAVFSVVDAVLLRALSLRDPDRVVMIWEKNPQLGAQIASRSPTPLSSNGSGRRRNSKRSADLKMRIST